MQVELQPGFRTKCLRAYAFNHYDLAAFHYYMFLPYSQVSLSHKTAKIRKEKIVLSLMDVLVIFAFLRSI